MGGFFIFNKPYQSRIKERIRGMRCWKSSYSRGYLPILMLGLLLPALPAGALTHTKLTGPLPLFGDVRSFQISPDGRYAVYLADQDTDEVFELYSVALSGGAPVRLNPLLPVGRNVESFQISPLILRQG